MTNKEMMQALADFATRIQFLEQDFARLVDDFGAYEDEAACAWCGNKGQTEDTEKCAHCGAEFCGECWEKALEWCSRKEKT